MRVPNIAMVSLVLAACGSGSAPSRVVLDKYVPRTRAVTITTVPLLVKELAKTYPFLEKDFAPGGVLAGKEVYAFSPSTVTAVSGDTLKLTLLNPEDDDHAFVLRDLFVKLPPQSRVDTIYIAKAPGIYEFSCSVPAHLPMMHGQLVVLSDDQFRVPVDREMAIQTHVR
jgi:uncharacterized cupredoxin-like copper-binding protein